MTGTITLFGLYINDYLWYLLEMFGLLFAHAILTMLFVIIMRFLIKVLRDN